MRLLLDTHVAIWSLTETRKLRTARHDRKQGQRGLRLRREYLGNRDQVSPAPCRCASFRRGGRGSVFQDCRVQFSRHFGRACGRKRTSKNSSGRPVRSPADRAGPATARSQATVPRSSHGKLKPDHFRFLRFSNGFSDALRWMRIGTPGIWKSLRKPLVR